ncbi:hypothetical protein QCA50_002231 [Cerrena zonata]|uniref:Uncharacterized protein n=1 Tax=Cerrena zonata TaxID=2478898 RepID=A0AAW0GWJ8_9APHY
MSGYGRFGGPEGLRGLTSPKAIITDRWPWLIQTTIPRVVDYPIPSVTQSSDFMTGMIGFVFADGWRRRYLYLMQLLRSSRQQQPGVPRPSPRR